jgi:hypothetical protein
MQWDDAAKSLKTGANTARRTRQKALRWAQHAAERAQHAAGRSEAKRTKKTTFKPYQQQRICFSRFCGSICTFFAMVIRIFAAVGDLQRTISLFMATAQAAVEWQAEVEGSPKQGLCQE